MNARVLDPRTTVYTQPDLTAATIAEFAENQETVVIGTTKRDNQTWVVIALADGRQGYLSSATRMYFYRSGRLVEDTAAHCEPSINSHVLERYHGGTTLLLIGHAVHEGRTWIQIRDAQGKEGFIFDDTRLEDPRRPTQADAEAAAARRNMVVGGLWCGGGIAVTAFTYASASGGGTYVVAWGAIIFGGLQFLKGLFASQ